MDCAQSEKNKANGIIDGFDIDTKAFTSLTVLMPTTRVTPIAKEYTANKVLQQLGYDNETDEDDESFALVENGEI